MTKVVHIVADGSPGGGSTYVLTLSSQLRDSGLNVVIITQSGSYLSKEAHRLGFAVIGLPFNKRSYVLITAYSLRRCLVRLQPTVVHAHGSRGGLVAALITQPKLWNFVYTVHGLHFINKRQPARLVGWLAEIICFARAQRILFVSQHDREEAARHGLLKGRRRDLVIPNAALVTRSTTEKAYDLCFLGRLVEQKNPLILTEILLAMRPLRPSLLVIGGGPLAEALKRQIALCGLERQVTMTGAVSHDDALKELARCRVLVHPARHEGQPLALIEAAHLGLPAVASAIPGCQEIVQDGETGYIVPPTVAGAYAARLRRLLAEPDLAARISLTAREKAARDFTIERQFTAHLEIYQSNAETLSPRADALRA